MSLSLYITKFSCRIMLLALLNLPIVLEFSNELITFLFCVLVSNDCTKKLFYASSGCYSESWRESHSNR